MSPVIRIQAPDDVPPARVDARRYVIAGSLIVAFMFGGFGAWAALAPLSGAVIAPSVVTVAGHRKTVQHLEGGIVTAILVREDEPVAAGQPLVRLDDTRARAAVGILGSELDGLQAREARLVAERDASPRVRFPADLLSRNEDPTVQAIVQAQVELFDARRMALGGEIEIFRQRAESYADEILGLEAQVRSERSQIENIQDELSGLRLLFEQGYTSRTRIRELEREVERLRGRLGEHLANIARAENGIGEAQLQVIQLEKDFREDVADELHPVQSRIFDLRERRTAALDELDRLELRAPRSGRVVGLAVHTVGGVVGAGEPLMQIVPEDDELVVDAHVRPEDVDKVRPGQEAVVRLTAFDRRTTPELRGSVISLSADRLTTESGSAYYLARTHIPEDELAKLRDLRLVPGMPAETFIQAGTRTLVSYLFKPLQDGLERAFRED